MVVVGRDRKGGPPREAACCFLTLGRGGIRASVPSSRRHTLSQLLTAGASPCCQENAGHGCCRRSFPLPSPLKPAGSGGCACARSCRAGMTPRLAPGRPAVLLFLAGRGAAPTPRPHPPRHGAAGERGTA